MPISRGWMRPEERCIICDERRGTIRTVDGLVCDRCMPRELLPSASTLKGYQIRSYCRTHDRWEPVAGAPESKTVGTVSGDRSMAITLSDPVVLADELNARIRESESIDLVVSFIKQSGLNLLMDSLREFSRHGRLRVITTAYMGATEYAALADLFSLPNTEVRMELDAERSRLHAKCFMFRRADGTEIAYVGSANISQTALTSGEEWVVKLRGEDVPQVLEDLHRGYQSLWDSTDVRRVTEKDRARIETALESRGM